MLNTKADTAKNPVYLNHF